MKNRHLLTERALVARINRTLAKQEQGLRRCRENSRWFHDLGRYYVVDQATLSLCMKDVEIEDLGRELGVLTSREAMVRD